MKARTQNKASHRSQGRFNLQTQDQFKCFVTFLLNPRVMNVSMSSFRCRSTCCSRGGKGWGRLGEKRRDGRWQHVHRPGWRWQAQAVCGAALGDSGICRRLLVPHHPAVWEWQSTLWPGSCPLCTSQEPQRYVHHAAWTEQLRVHLKALRLIYATCDLRLCFRLIFLKSDTNIKTVAYNNHIFYEPIIQLFFLLQIVIWFLYLFVKVFVSAAK